MNSNVTKRPQRKSRRQDVEYQRWTRALGQGLRLECFLPVRHASPLSLLSPFRASRSRTSCAWSSTPSHRPLNHASASHVCVRTVRVLAVHIAPRPLLPRPTSPDQSDATCPRQSIHIGTFGRAVPSFLGPRPWSSRCTYRYYRKSGTRRSARN